MRRLAPLAVLLASLLPAAASAQAPIDTGPGFNPRIAVDSSGVAHLTSVVRLPGQADNTQYCRLAVGGTNCSPTGIFSYANEPNEGLSSGAWPLVPGDGRVLVVDARCCRAYAEK